MQSIEKPKRAGSISKVSNQLTTEHDEQVTVVEWANLSLGKYPELKLLYAIPNASGFANTKPFVKNGVKLPPLPLLKKIKEGLKKGIPDLCLPVARGGYHSLYIEMKRFDGKLSKDQVDIQSALVEQGHYVATCYDASEAIKVLSRYLEMRTEGAQDDMDRRSNTSRHTG